MCTAHVLMGTDKLHSILYQLLVEEHAPTLAIIVRVKYTIYPLLLLLLLLYLATLCVTVKRER